MTTGDDMEIAVKNKRSENVTWTAPVVMASNHTPGYVNTGDNVGRRLVMIRFDRVVHEPPTDLLPRILAEELPAVVARCVGASAALGSRRGPLEARVAMARSPCFSNQKAAPLPGGRGERRGRVMRWIWYP